MDRYKVEHEGTEVGFDIHVDDGWYGKNYFYFLKTDIPTMTKANREHKSMVKKFIKKYHLRSDDRIGRQTTLKKGDEQTTYIHTVGPCYALERIEINVEKFTEFVEEETARLEEGRERRKYEKERREQWKMRSRFV